LTSITYSYRVSVAGLEGNQCRLDQHGERLEGFGWGCAGSFAHEVVLFCEEVRTSKTCRWPAPYTRPAFLAGRALLIVVAGVFTSAWGISNPLQGIALGAATPRLMQKFGQLGLRLF